MVVGYLISVPPSQWSTHGVRLLCGAAIWGVLLNGGTVALNSAFDRDTGDVSFLNSPPPIPKGLWGFGLALMLLGMILAAAMSLPFMVAYILSFVMSIIYSCPPLRLKARPGPDIFINALGYGALTAFAGWSCGREEVTGFIVLVCVAYAFLFACLYPLTQLYQWDEDRAKGDRTFAVALGRSRALRFSLVCLICAFAIFGYSAYSERAATFILIPVLLIWLAVLIPWILTAPAYPEKPGMYRAYCAWVLTDIAVVLCFSLP